MVIEYFKQCLFQTLKVFRIGIFRIFLIFLTSNEHEESMSEFWEIQLYLTIRTNIKRTLELDYSDVIKRIITSHHLLQKIPFIRHFTYTKAL